jgi:hypothetical protein
VVRSCETGNEPSDSEKMKASRLTEGCLVSQELCPMEFINVLIAVLILMDMYRLILFFVK